MGVSVPIASAIILTGAVIFIGSLSASLLYGIHYFSDLATYERYVKSRLELNVLSVTGRSVEFSVSNHGPSTVFLVSRGGYMWSSVIISYRSGSRARTYLVEDYVVLEINVTGTNVSFSPSEHPFIGPGETARIRASIPSDAPEIEVGSPVKVVFASRFGEVAEDEDVRT